MSVSTADSSCPVTLRLSLPCELDEVRPTAEILHDFLNRHGWNGNTVNACELAFVEACNNAIKYADKAARKQPVLVEALVERSKLEIRITDHTRGFDWPEKINLPEPDSENGRGLYLITTLMDEAKYFRSAGENILVMRKTRDEEESGDAKLSLEDEGRTAHELDIARNIQHSLLLQTLPQVPSFTLSGFCKTAREVGGDYYDALRVNDHSLMLVIADVMGKGIPAALFAASLRTLLRATPELTRRPAMLMTRTNRLLYRDLSEVNMFITAQFIYFDAKTEKALIANAGHCPILLAKGEETKTISPDGMPLGILPHSRYQEESLELTKDCRMLLYTDGVIETRNAQGQEFGQERLLRWLAEPSRKEQTAEQLKEALAAELDRFRNHATLKDDETFVIVAGGN
jgi:serine phosphatase RsbU (regulator of sigma subunit)